MYIYDSRTGCTLFYKKNAARFISYHVKDSNYIFVLKHHMNTPYFDDLKEKGFILLPISTLETILGYRGTF